MITKRELAIVILTVCLTVTLFTTLRAGSQTVEEYDPWLDINDNGHIDGSDIAHVARAFGTAGTPINKTELLLDLLARVEALEAKFPVGTDNIADSAVVTAKLADGSVTSAKILDGSVTAEDMSDNSVITAKIVDSGVTTAKVANGAVTADKIADNAILTIKLANGAVTSAKILDGSVTGVDLATNTITSLNIANGAVTTDKIADGSVTFGKLAASAIPCALAYAQGSSPDFAHSWTDMQDMSVTINLTRTSNLIILFNGYVGVENLNMPGTKAYLIVRAPVNATYANPLEMDFTPYYDRSDEDTAAYSANFFLASLSPGTYTVKMQWMIVSGDSTSYKYAGWRSLIVYGLPA